MAGHVITSRRQVSTDILGHDEYDQYSARHHECDWHSWNSLKKLQNASAVRHSLCDDQRTGHTVREGLTNGQSPKQGCRGVKELAYEQAVAACVFVSGRGDSEDGLTHFPAV